METKAGLNRSATTGQTLRRAIARSLRMKTRVGFVGAGGIANRHIGNLLAFDDVTVLAVADPQLDRAEAAAARVGGRAYNRHEAMLDAEKLDAVYVCTPPFAHGPPELACIDRGLHFFVEKPIAADLATAEQIAAAAAAAAGLVTGTGYHWRYLDITE